MSAWPEAVWIVKELEKSLNIEIILSDLERRLDAIERRVLIIAPVGEIPANASEGSLWFKQYR